MARLSRIILLLMCLFSLQFLTVFANVEKVIFVAPELTNVPQDASIDNLLLASLNPQHLTTRTYLNASFPSTEHPKGIETWVLLEGLHPGQRYEVRVCWLATQPTSFWLNTYIMSKVFETPDLISSLNTYAYARHAQLSPKDIKDIGSQRFRSKTTELSLLFLRIHAAADYFTLDQKLMQDVPPVHVDIILDPYIFNVLPQSLLYTSLYIVVLAIIGWFLAGWLYRELKAVNNTETDSEKKSQ